MRRTLAVLAMVSAAATGAEIDRIAVVVGRQVITESQVNEEVRVTEFLNNEPLDVSREIRRAAAHRLVDQALLEREMRMSRFLAPTEAAVDEQMRRVQGQFPSTNAFSEALARCQLSESVLREHLALQLAMTNFVSVRFSPETKAELKAARDFSEQKADEALDAWLRQARVHTSVTYLDGLLRPQLGTPSLPQ